MPQSRSTGDPDIVKSLNSLLCKSGQPGGRSRSGAQRIQRTSPMEPMSRTIRPELYFSNVSILSA